MSLFKKLANSFRFIIPQNNKHDLGVESVPVGHYNDGLVQHSTNLNTTSINRRGLQIEARTMSRMDSLYKRGLITLRSYVLGSSFMFRTESKELHKHVSEITGRMLFDDFLTQMFDELINTGNLFIACHLVSNIELRIIPTQLITKIVTDPEDYTKELEYHEEMIGEGKKWLSPHHEDANPFVMHYKINAASGEVFGVGEFAASHIWMARYNKMVTDRVHINVLSRSFFWLVKIPNNLWKDLKGRFKKPPKSGTTVVVPEGVDITALTPNVGAKDFRYDRTAILELVATGMAGLSPIDFGELDTSNLATANVVAKNKAVIMRRIQKSFFDFVSHVIITSINKQNKTEFTTNDLTILLNPINDMEAVTTAAALAKTYQGLVEVFGESAELRRLLLTLFLNTMGSDTYLGEGFEEICK